MTRIRTAAVVLALLVAACGGSAEGPPDIEYGRDVCADCGMIIEEPRFATAYRAGDEEWLFDDMVDMLGHAREAGELASATFWVHDYGTEEWIAAPDAAYVSGPIATPMGGGIVAFAAPADADALAAEVGGEVLTWDDLVQLAESGGLQQGHMTMTPEEGH